METIKTASVISPEAFLAHWQGHRALTRRVIEAFPEKELFSFSVGGMRTFAVLAMEMADLAGPGLKGIITGEWDRIDQMPHHTGKGMPETKEGLLALWDEQTRIIDHYWKQLEPERFGETVRSFGAYEGLVHEAILYYIDNEIHHRGQGYVYLRALGIEPPAFWDR